MSNVTGVNLCPSPFFDSNLFPDGGGCKDIDPSEPSLIANKREQLSMEGSVSRLATCNAAYRAQ